MHRRAALLLALVVSTLACPRSAPPPVIQADVQRVVCAKGVLLEDLNGVPRDMDAGCDP